MNRRHSDPSSEFSEEQEFLQRAVRFQDRALSAAELHQFETELLQDEQKRRWFAELQLQSAAIVDLARREAYVTSVSIPLTPSAGGRSIPGRHLGRLVSLGGWLLAAAACLAFLVQSTVWNAPEESSPNRTAATPITIPPDLNTPAVEAFNPPVRLNDVLLTGASRASFLGELVPPLTSPLNLMHDYVLTSGLVELTFPDGASAIVEAPAVFRIENKECLALDGGQCSVHAPDGAEGFRVETPVSRVIDRGTRFHINVSDSSETEVQVIEGKADVYLKPGSDDSRSPDGQMTDLPLDTRMEVREARRISTGMTSTAVPVEFSPDQYRDRLPDRIIRYRAATAEGGGIDELLGVTVQRNGVVREYNVEDLIPIQLTWFKSYPDVDRSGHLVGTPSLPARRSTLLEDRLLSTGIINPGGQKEPLKSDPVIQIPEDPSRPNTPGFAVRFRSPVVNRPGPDVLFFELQSLTNPPNGDAFHVSPMHFTSGRRSTTVSVYDLTIVSPEVQKLAPFHLYQFADPVESLNDLENLAWSDVRRQTGFLILATGIDLSDLGYQDGEQVEELFFQDANDDKQLSRVDPVFIAGLPDDESRKAPVTTLVTAPVTGSANSR